jgi:propanol-preferring alcohol dehydrogenase
MSPTPPLDYRLLYHERVVRSVANNTRADGAAFLAEAAAIPVRTRIEVFPFAEADRALACLARDAIAGAAVLAVG